MKPLVNSGGESFDGGTKHEVKAIDSALRIFNMDYRSVHYLGSREVRGRPDSDLVDLQQRELIQNGKWLEDDAAKLLLEAERQEQK